MAPFQAKIGCKMQRKKENKNCHSVHSVPTLRVIENPKKIAKKLKNSVMYSFQAKIGFKMMRKRENKNYRSVSFQLDA